MTILRETAGPVPAARADRIEVFLAALLPTPLRGAVALWFAIFAFMLFKDLASLSGSLGDTDDAMRLVQWRAFLDGAGWYDLRIARVQPPEGLVSHWSRLVDAGLTLLYRGFALFLPAREAELAMRATWPLLWVLPALLAVTMIAWRIGGRLAAWGCLAVAAFSLQAYIQFTPGRVDHHNVQIALSLVMLALVAWSDRTPSLAFWAGLTGGAVLTIGLEALPMVVAAGMMAVAVGVMSPDGAQGARILRLFGIAFALSALVGLAVSQPPSRWFGHAVCDAMAMNIAYPVAAGGLLLALLSTGAMKREGPLRRVLALMPAPVMAAGVFVVLDPACLRGPFAHVDPALFPIWLDRVKEVRSARELLSDGKLSTLVLLHLYPLMAVAAGVLLLRKWREDVDAKVLTAVLSVHVLAVALGFGAVRLMSYANWTALPVMGILVSQLWRSLSIRALPRRILAGIALSPLVPLMLSALMLSVGSGTVSASTPSCTTANSMHPLAALPRGRVAAPVDLGPFILALTPHEVLAAPYHRLDRGIIDSHALLAGSPRKALRLALQWKLNYVVLCSGKRTGGTGGTDGESLARLLERGRPPFWLEPVTAGQKGPLKIYRVVFRGSL